MSYLLRFDGGCNNNPGSGGSGTVIYKNSVKIAGLAKYFSWTTNNEAEYNGLIHGLEWLFQNQLNDIKTLTIEGDSQLVIKHNLKEWKVKAENLKPLFNKVQSYFEVLQKSDVEIILRHIPRKENSEADNLSNEVRIQKEPIERIF